MKKLISLLLCLSFIFLLSSCKKDGDPIVPQKNYKTRNKTISTVYFNTYSQISTYKDKDDTVIEGYVKTADELLSYYHHLFDIYFEYAGVSNIKTINKNAGISPVTVDREMIVFLEYCKELYTITNGKTNIMLGSVLKIWHECRESATLDFGYLDPGLLPTADELRIAAEHTSIDSLIIDKEASTVYISDPEASIDVGAVAKGYAVDMLCKKLVSEGADSVVLNIGGNIRTIGLKPNGDKWTSGISNPDKSSEESLICRLKIGATSIVTSGDYERYFYSGDTKYHHIIDPATSMPARYFSAVSIITESSALGDALSTALFCMTYEEGLALVNSIGGVEVIWVDLGYNVRMTPGIELVSD